MIRSIQPPFELICCYVLSQFGHAELLQLLETEAFYCVMRDAGGEQVGRGMSPWRDLSRVHSATLLGMLQFVVHEAVGPSQGVSARELCSMLVRLASKVR